MSKSEGRSEILNTSVFRGGKRGYPCVVRGASERCTRGAQNVEIRELSYRARKIRAKSHRIRIVKKADLWRRGYTSRPYARSSPWIHISDNARYEEGELAYRHLEPHFHHNLSFMYSCIYYLQSLALNYITLKKLTNVSTSKLIETFTGMTHFFATSVQIAIRFPWSSAKRSNIVVNEDCEKWVVSVMLVRFF